jgi:transcription antitermination factor NusG
VVALVSTNGRPEPVPEDEIDAIQRLIQSKLPYDPHPALSVGMEVEVIRGPLAGIRGCLLRKDRVARLVISVTLIRQAAAVDVHPADVMVTGQPRQSARAR